MLLYPDMSHKAYKASDHFMFAAPCSEADWNTLRALATSDNSHLPFTFIKELPEHNSPSDTTCIILMEPNTPDDDAIDTAAWIRVTEEYTDMIYALTFLADYYGEASFAAIVARTAGVDPKQVRHIELLDCT